MYDLCAVSNHFGTLTGGHYTAFCKSPESGEWHDYNDSSVSKVYNESSIVSKSAYVLYYVRKDFLKDGNYNFNAIKNFIPGYDLNTGLMQGELLKQPEQTTTNGQIKDETLLEQSN